jgi:iron(III) transport system permease protein
MGGSLIRSWRVHQQRVVLGAAGLAVGACCVLPLLALLGETGGAAGQAFEMWSSPRPWLLLSRSIGLAAAVTALALAIGVPLGVLLGRADVVGRRAVGLLHATPLFLPPFLLALGWFQVFGRRGAFGSDATSAVLFSGPGVILVLTLAFTPVISSLVALALQGVDPSLEEAGRLVAGPLRVVVGIVLPAVAPAIVLGAIVVFSLAFSELGVPMFLRVETFPTAVFARLGGIDYQPEEALALVLPLAPLALLLLAVERRLVGRRSFAVLRLRSDQRETLRLGRWRWPATAGAWLLALAASAPLAALLGRAAVGGGLAQVGSWLGRSPVNGLAAGVVAATLITGIGIVVGHAVARDLPGSGILDSIVVLAFLTPAAVLGIGVIEAWNRPSLRVLYGGLGILVIGYAGRYLVIGTRAMAAIVAQGAVHLEEAAASAGAGFIRRLVRLVVPLHARGILFVWLLVLVFCLRDLETAVLFYPPGGEPTTVRIFTLEANGPEPVVAALACVHVAVTAVLIMVGAWLGRRAGMA